MFLICPGRCRNDASFNMGVACALLYLIGASKTEITKMVEVRKQMEILLRNFTEELQNRNSGLKTIEIDDSVAYSTNHIRESSNSSTQISLQMNSARTTSYVVPESEIILECGDSFRRVVHEREQHLTGMDELEAELEAELELLELHVDTEHPLVLPQQQRLKVERSALHAFMIFYIWAIRKGVILNLNMLVFAELIVIYSVFRFPEHVFVDAKVPFKNLTSVFLVPLSS